MLRGLLIVTATGFVLAAATPSLHSPLPSTEAGPVTLRPPSPAAGLSNDRLALPVAVILQRQCGVKGADVLQPSLTATHLEMLLPPHDNDLPLYIRSFIDLTEVGCSLHGMRATLTEDDAILVYDRLLDSAEQSMSVKRDLLALLRQELPVFRTVAVSLDVDLYSPELLLAQPDTLSYEVPADLRPEIETVLAEADIQISNQVKDLKSEVWNDFERDQAAKRDGPLLRYQSNGLLSFEPAQTVEISAMLKSWFEDCQLDRLLSGEVQLPSELCADNVRPMVDQLIERFRDEVQSKAFRVWNCFMTGQKALMIKDVGSEVYLSFMRRGGVLTRGLLLALLPHGIRIPPETIEIEDVDQVVALYPLLQRSLPKDMESTEVLLYDDHGRRKGCDFAPSFPLFEKLARDQSWAHLKALMATPRFILTVRRWPGAFVAALGSLLADHENGPLVHGDARKLIDIVMKQPFAAELQVGEDLETSLMLQMAFGHVPNEWHQMMVLSAEQKARQRHHEACNRLLQLCTFSEKLRRLVEDSVGGLNPKTRILKQWRKKLDADDWMLSDFN